MPSCDGCLHTSYSCDVKGRRCVRCGLHRCTAVKERGCKQWQAPRLFDIEEINLCRATVCTNIPDHDARQRLALRHYPGRNREWKIHSTTRCPDRTRCRHVLFVCV